MKLWTELLQTATTHSMNGPYQNIVASGIQYILELLWCIPIDFWSSLQWNISSQFTFYSHAQETVLLDAKITEMLTQAIIFFSESTNRAQTRVVISLEVFGTFGTSMILLGAELLPGKAFLVAMREMGVETPINSTNICYKQNHWRWMNTCPTWCMEASPIANSWEIIQFELFSCYYREHSLIRAPEKSLQRRRIIVSWLFLGCRCIFTNSCAFSAGISNVHHSKPLLS